MIHLTETKAAVMTGAALVGGTIGQVFGGMDAALITLLHFYGSRLSVRSDRRGRVPFQR